MHIILGIIFFVHGLAHVVGFVVPWKIAKLDDAPYKTSLLNGIINVGDSGIRLIGILWLIAAHLFFAIAIGVFTTSFWWQDLTFYAALFSLLLSIFGLPDSKIGILVNIAILVFLIYGEKVGLLPISQQ